MDNFIEKWLFAYYQIGKRYFFLAAVMFILFYIISYGFIFQFDFVETKEKFS